MMFNKILIIALITTGMKLNSMTDIERKLNHNFVFAAQSGRSEIIKQAIDLGLDVNISWQGDGNTALILASDKGHLDIVQMLIKAKADVNKANQHGTTALHTAINGGHFKIAKLLVEIGADVNALSLYMGYPLHIAIKKRRRKFVRFLMQNGANPLQKHREENAVQLAERLVKEDQEAEKSQHDRDAVLIEHWNKLEPKMQELYLLAQKNKLNTKNVMRIDTFIINIINEYTNNNSLNADLTKHLIYSNNLVELTAISPKQISESNTMRNTLCCVQ